jgi:hypothetical protein
MLKLITIAASFALAAQDAQKTEAAKPQPPKRFQLTPDEIKDLQIIQQSYQLRTFRICERADIKTERCMVDTNTQEVYERPLPPPPPPAAAKPEAKK